MQLLTNEVLLDSYNRAVDLKLDHQFIQILEDEIHRRGINRVSESDSNERDKRNWSWWNNFKYSTKALKRG
jgi:developmental checkpoint coupling sporulation initiation to replication initiation